MQIEQTIMIDGYEVYDTKQKIMGLRIFARCSYEVYDTYQKALGRSIRCSAGNYDIKYVVDDKGEVKSVITIETDCSQNYGYVSDFSVEDVK